MLASLTLLLGLPLALATKLSCDTRLVTVTFDNATIPGLLGHWVYIGGASTYPPHQEELKAVKHASFSLFPSSHEDELNVTEIMKVNETCMVKTTGKIHVFHHSSTLMHVDDQGASTAQLIQSDKDLLIMKHIKDDFKGLSLSARTPNVSKEHLKEFEAQLHCLGFTDEEVFFTSEQEACPLPGEKTGEGNVEQQLA